MIYNTLVTHNLLVYRELVKINRPKGILEQQFNNCCCSCGIEYKRKETLSHLFPSSMALPQEHKHKHILYCMTSPYGSLIGTIRGFYHYRQTCTGIDQIRLAIGCVHVFTALALVLSCYYKRIPHLLHLRIAGCS
jgi:hypothetical protein